MSKKQSKKRNAENRNEYENKNRGNDARNENDTDCPTDKRNENF